MKIHRVWLVTFALLALGALCVAQRPEGSMGQMGQMPRSTFGPSVLRESGALSGSVRDTNNKPLGDVRVDLTDARGVIINTSYTNATGNFEFPNISAGGYNVVATEGLHQVSERVEVSSWTSNVSLRMPTKDKPADGVQGNSISVVQYK